MPSGERFWCPEAIAGATAATLVNLQRAALLEGFYLAGGTGLALQFGHRLSRDLDFFATDLFDEEAILQPLQQQPEFSLVSIAPHTLHASIQQTKVSFLGYDYPILFPFGRFSDAAVADPRDIGCMKVSAVASRGTKRDFIDLYVASQRFGLAEILNLFSKKYVRTNYSRVHILKSLTFFDDANQDPMPHMLVRLDWDEAKQFFLQQVPRLV
jgi:hypothetical protein